MAITVRKAFDDKILPYSIKLLAGEKGLNNFVSWVHIIEETDSSEFLHGNEIVFTSGILNRYDAWLYDFVKNLHKSKVSAFVVNLGPYVSYIPKNVIDYCNEVNLPLYTIPWATRMVDVTRDICYKIMDRKNEEISVSQAMQNIIFNIGDIQKQILKLESVGFLRNKEFCFFALSFLPNEGNAMEYNHIENIKNKVKQIAASINEFWITFTYQNVYIVATSGYTEEEIKEFTSKVTQGKDDYLCMGVSGNTRGIENQSDNFKKALMALKVCKAKSLKIMYYDNLDIYKIILNINNNNILKEFYNETIGIIEQYDKENNTNLTEFLRTYINNNGSSQLVAKEMFIHRNTVTNMLKKIEKITGRDPLELKEKIRFGMGFYIEDIM